MTVINSVLGPLDTADLGFTLSHEHVLETSAGLQQVYPEFIDRDRGIRKGVEALKEAYEAGVRTIVDVTTFDLGRDVKLLEQVSRESKIHIICSTGIWLDIPRAFWYATPDMIAPLFIKEIEDGIEGTGIKAGVIKVATDVGGITAPGEIVLRAASKAQRATGVPISTHAWALERAGEAQIRVFQEEGVDLNRVYIGHSNDSTDLDYLLNLLELGVWVGLDRLPAGHRPGTPNWETRTTIVKKLIDAGFGHRIMLSHDWQVTLWVSTIEMLESRRKYNPDGYNFISRKVLPRLRQLGISDDVIYQIMVENPRRFFEG